MKSLFQFTNPRIKQSEFVVNEDFDSEKYKGLDVTYSSKIDMKGEDNATIELTMHIGKQDSSSPFHILMVMYAEFIWDNDDYECKENYESLLKQNGVAVLVSYMRPHIAYLTSNAGFPAYHLPFLNIKDDNNE